MMPFRSILGFASALFLWNLPLQGVDPNLFDGSDFPVPESAGPQPLQAALDHLLNQTMEGLAEAVRPPAASEPAPSPGSARSEDSEADSASRTFSQANDGGGADPEIRLPQVVFGSAELRIPEDPNAVGARLGQPVTVSPDTSGGVAGSGPDRSRTPRGAARGSDLPTDL